VTFSQETGTVALSRQENGDGGDSPIRKRRQRRKKGAVTLSRQESEDGGEKRDGVFP